MDEGRAMRVINTTPAASLDMGKGQGNHSSDARSWGISQAIFFLRGRTEEVSSCCGRVLEKRAPRMTVKKFGTHVQPWAER